MGVYRYTLRKQTIEVDGLTIGRFGYAYKESFWCREASYARKIAQMSAHADRAREANPDLTLVVLGEFSYAKEEELPVMHISSTISEYSDGGTLGPIVGYLRREGRRYSYRAVEMAA